ncbi:MAG: ABC transporter permease [Thermodesulfobacteriota bacterium]
MLATDLLKLSWLQIYRNKRRYKGAFVGISLGIAALITVLTIGDSVESNLGYNLEVLGSATIVKAEWDFARTVRWHQGEYSDKDIDGLRELPGVLAVAPAVWSREKEVHHRREKMGAKLMGVTPDFFKALHLPVTRGRIFTQEDVDQRRHVCVIGKKVEDKFFRDGTPALDQVIAMQGRSFRVVGVLGGAEDQELLESILLPISVARSQFPAMDKIRDVYIRAVNWDVVPGLKESAEQLLRTNQPGYASAIHVKYYAESLSIIKAIIFVFKFFVYAAIGVTLALGGLGITNVMLAVVSERTREVGLRKAVGATEPMIMLQFMCESLTVSLIGAAAGMTLGIISVYFLSNALDMDPNYRVMLASLFSSVVLGMVIGVLSGVIPARKAGKLDPVDAMRFE